MSVIHRFTGSQSGGNYEWEGVSRIEINAQGVKGVVKHVLAGPEDGAPTFVMRYFQVPVGGKTFHHEHPHEHGMLILHGTAEIQINDAFFTLHPLDAVFVSGDDLHQVLNNGNKPLGFLCIIPKLETEA